MVFVYFTAPPLHELLHMPARSFRAGAGVTRIDDAREALVNAL